MVRSTRRHKINCTEQKPQSKHYYSIITCRLCVETSMRIASNVAAEVSCIGLIFDIINSVQFVYE